MAVTVILEVRAKQGTGNDLVTTFKEILPDTRAYDGCISIELLQDQDDADVLVIFEKWQSRDQYQKYLAWRQETGFVAQLVDAIDGNPSIRYFDLADG